MSSHMNPGPGVKIDSTLRVHWNMSPAGKVETSESDGKFFHM